MTKIWCMLLAWMCVHLKSFQDSDEHDTTNKDYLSEWIEARAIGDKTV